MDRPQGQKSHGKSWKVYIGAHFGIGGRGITAPRRAAALPPGTRGAPGARRLNWLKLFSGAVGMGSWGLSGWCLRVPPTSLGGWGTGDTPHLPRKCPWQNFPQQPRKPGHQTAGGGRGPGVCAVPPSAPRAVYRHPGRSPSGWFGRGVACGPPAPVAASL